jgi:microsomal dipeptidase-like Zn-dependent dipeptidase
MTPFRVRQSSTLLTLGSLSVFYPVFIGPTPETANTSRVADHIEYIASIVGRNHVGIGSDFDGMYSSVIGLEDASKYPNLVSTSQPKKTIPHRFPRLRN